MIMMSMTWTCVILHLFLYRLVRYDGTECSAMVVPIHALQWYRFADTVTQAAFLLLLRWRKFCLLKQFLHIVGAIL